MMHVFEESKRIIIWMIYCVIKHCYNTKTFERCVIFYQQPSSFHRDFITESTSSIHKAGNILLLHTIKNFLTGCLSYCSN